MPLFSDLHAFGQRIWLDNLTRGHIRDGRLAQLIAQGVTGITSNPTIFYKAVTETSDYAGQIDELRKTEPDPERRYEALVSEDLRAACDLFQPVYVTSGGDDGYVSWEVAPRFAQDADRTVAEAKRLHDLVGRDNLLIKVPGNVAGLRAFEQLTAQGLRVNVTLLFSLHHVARTFEAYIRGARQWLDKGGDPLRLKAVASLFLSRVDTLVDKRLEALGTPQALALRGKTAVALARLSYQRYQDFFLGDDYFAHLRAHKVRSQYLLWASTGTKNPAYSDLLYVEPLIGSDTINTLPDKTLAALADHGVIESTLHLGIADAMAHMVELESLGIDPSEIGEELQVEGLRLFAESYDKLIAAM
ncbi:MAG: transaldolase [Pseudomonadota bacterium]